MEVQEEGMEVEGEFVQNVSKIYILERAYSCTSII